MSEPTIQLTPPDIAPLRHGNTGIDYVTTLDGGRPGPHVVVNALTHGNEICGAIAIDTMFRLGIKPKRGRLTLSLSNVAAYRGFDPHNPYASRFVDEDFNRLWSRETLESRRDSRELRRARELRPVFESADLLLDIHSMTNDTPPLTLCGRTARGRELACRLGFPSWIVADEGHASGRRLMDHDGFADPEGERTAILVECGQHWRAETGVVAVETCLRFLAMLDMVDAAVAAPHMRPHAGPRRLVEVTDAVTARSDAFTFAGDFVGLEVLPKAGTLLGRDGDRRILTPYDDCVLIMPARRVKPGQTAVRLGRIVG